MDIKQLALKIAEYVAANSWKTSAALFPEHMRTREMNADDLMKFIVEDCKVVTGDEINRHLENAGL